MLTLDTSNTNSQSASPLFNQLPQEIRDHIFELALTPYTNKYLPYPRNAKYYRPNFRYANQHLSCALLRTCHRVYSETYFLPACNYVLVQWRYNGPPSIRTWTDYPPELRSLHLFTQQNWLESWGWAAEQISQRAQNLRRLRITLRHCDWWSWEASAPLMLDAKQAGTASETEHSAASDGFDVRSWGYHFRVFKGLEVFELELETVENKRGELDAIVARAVEWRFPLTDGHRLVCNTAKIKRNGWHGLKFEGEFNHVPNHPTEARQRLEKDGVDFRVPDDEPEIFQEDCFTYYVVTLTYEAQGEPRASDAPIHVME